MKPRLFTVMIVVLTSLLASAQNTTSYTYDAMNRLMQVTYSNGTIVTYSYDALGNRTKKTVSGATGLKEAYAWLSSDGKTLTFCYDNDRDERNGTTYDLNEGDDDPEWNLDPSNNPCGATLVVFEHSFTNARPTSTCKWFYNFSELSTILGMEYLNTSEVTDMSRMFAGCVKLSQIDLSHFNTSKVETMFAMFWRCYADSLDVSSFDTSNVTNMESMFSLCGLNDLDVSNFNTSKVKSMYGMFSSNAFTHLDLSNFDTSNVTNMSFMFSDCFKLESINLDSFNTSNVENFYAMFYRCWSLKCLDVSHFDISSATYWNWYFYVDEVFSNCTGLQRLCVSLGMSELASNACSNVGTAESPCTLVAPDGFDFGVDTSGEYFVWKSGYFKLENMKEAYAWLSNDSTTLTFCCDGVRYEREGTTYDLRMKEDQEYEYWLPSWQEFFDGKDCKVSTVVINPSFADARPFYTSYWFQNMPRLESITGLEYLNTSEVKSMYNMFSECSSLTTIDLSHFETSKVKNMSEMFDGCTGLKRLDLSHFKTDSLERMNFMFGDCSNLESIVFGSINTSNLKECHYMFWNCSSLKRLDLRSFDFSNVTSSTWMLTNCVGLESLVIPYSMEIINENACSGIGSGANPCAITAPAGFDFGVDTSGDYFIWKRGRFKLGSGVLGDLDGNGRVSIDDLTTLIGYLLSGDATGLDLANADCYQDGRISIDDVTALINYLLSGSW